MLMDIYSKKFTGTVLKFLQYNERKGNGFLKRIAMKHYSAKSYQKANNFWFPRNQEIQDNFSQVKSWVTFSSAVREL